MDVKINNNPTTKLAIVIKVEGMEKYPESLKIVMTTAE